MALSASDISNFLFGGTAPPSVTKYGTSQQNIPQFMTDYTLGLLNKANAVLAEKYQPYNAPRISGFTPDQLKAQKLTEQSVGRFMPDVARGKDITTSSLGYNAARAADPFMDQAGGINAMRAARPNLMEASDIDALGISSPYARRAGQTFTGRAVDQYMNPYIGGVVNRLGDLAARNLQEKFLPQISQDFIRSGTYGSSGQQRAVGQALRDVQESALAAQNEALAQGYKTSADIFASDVGRQAQLAQQQGNLALGQQQNLGTLGQIAGNLALGQQQNLGQLGQIAGNMASQTARDRLAAAQQLANLGQLGQSMNYKDIAALAGVGGEQQALKQKSLDLAYQDFMRQQDYPYTQLQRMNELIRGLPMSTQTSTSSTGPLAGASYGPSTASILAALASGGLGFKEGGQVKRNPNRRSTRGRKRR